MKTDSPSLQDLLAQTGRGDHAAFATVYERTHAHLFGLALRMLGREQAAEDVLQEAFVSVWKSAALYRTHIGGQEVQPMTWLIAIVRNKALDALRSRARRRETELPDEPEDESEGAARTGAPSALELLSRASRALQIEGCLGGLDGSHRQSLALAYYQGLSHSEVAARMGAPLGSVKAWIRRGLEKLKACLTAQGLAL
ncbi:MAG: polymerase subunit sigma-24 [Ramlibacter sp.]|nr:polymerase subunit sigma-24 [Ramlibacter sp.]